MAAAEFAAVAFGVAYILLAIREHRACWIAGGIGTAIYAAVFLEAGLPMQAALQLVYVAMSAYGWFAWRADIGGRGSRPRLAMAPSPGRCRRDRRRNGDLRAARGALRARRGAGCRLARDLGEPLRDLAARAPDHRNLGLVDRD